eukprot:866415-Karenia_brevis.AAC.1
MPKKKRQQRDETSSLWPFRQTSPQAARMGLSRHASPWKHILCDQTLQWMSAAKFPHPPTVQEYGAVRCPTGR